MKKILVCTLLFSLFFTPLSIKAQQATAKPTVCGLSTQDADILYNEMIALRERHPIVAPMRAVAYVPVWFHLVAKDDGTGRIGMNKILEMLCEWNRLYSVNGVELQFYIKGINNINNSGLYDSQRTFSGDIAIRNNKKNDGINVFLVNNANDPAQPNSTVLGYYLNTGTGAPYEADWFIVINSQANIGGAVTIAHEAGHFFSLPHPFYGWETCPFVPTAANDYKAPATVNCFGNGTYTVENVARTGSDANCSTAGDGFCDTPANYNLGYGYTGSNRCVYVGLASDPKGVKVDPDETNIMDYFTGCETSFSPMQKTAMQNNYLNHSSRAYIRSGNIAPTATTLAAPTLSAPISGATSTYYNAFTLSWTAVPNATGYVVELSKTPTFFDSRIFVATTNSFSINATNAPGYLTAVGQNYYWRIKPYSNYVSCSEFTTRQNFTSGNLLSATKEISGISNFEVSPNPLSKTQSLQLNLTSEIGFDAQVKLFNVTGQLVQSEKRHFEIGFSSQNLSVSNLTNGLYILTVESENGIINKKVVIRD